MRENDSIDSLAHAMARFGKVFSTQKPIVPAWKTMRDKQVAADEYAKRQELVKKAQTDMSSLDYLLGLGNHQIVKLDTTATVYGGRLVIEYKRE